ncbi:MAG TPA: cytidine deaminase [Gemmatimonadaceae bacterium]|nr:cytidine deaminase [Gemmatimonadaceae bacterium]
MKAPSAEATIEEAARSAMERAYAPYSHFRVGAALRAADGRVVSGCNVENSAFPAGICAERAAVAAAVVQGVRDLEELVVITEAEAPAPPCGMCRQVLQEMAPGLRITSLTIRGARAEWWIAELLPHPFTSGSLGYGHSVQNSTKKA